MSSAAGGSSTSTVASDDVTAHNLGVLFNLLFFSALMGAVPYATFTASQSGFFDSLYEQTFGVPSNSQRIVYSGFAAVLSVNLVIAAFIIKAFCEPAPPSAAVKKQQ